MSKSKIFFCFCLFFIAGIFLRSFISSFLVLSFFVGIVIFLILLFNKESNNFIFLFFSFLFLVLGIWRFHIADSMALKSELNAVQKNEKIVLIGKIIKEPDVRISSKRLIINPEQIQDSKNIYNFIKGNVLLVVPRYTNYQYGDRIKVLGKLEDLPVFSDFNYKDYLRKDSIYYQLNASRIEVLEKNQGNIFLAKVLSFKNKLRSVLYQNISLPQGAILAAMLLGDKNQLSEELKEQLNIAGVRHITAISGLHITVLSAILMNLFLFFGLWRQQAYWFSVIFIALFIIMTGFQPSAVRAGIMGGIFLTAQYIGKQNNSLRAIVFAGTLMLIFNPLLLKFDVGFQLSFLAMLGIIYFLPVFEHFMDFIKNNYIKSILAMTLSAYFFTFPIIIYNFGYLSLIAPLTNLLIIPFLYPLMFLGLIFLFSGMVFPLLAWFLSLFLWLILTLIIKIVGFFSQIPLAALKIENVHWFWLIILYFLLISISYKIYKSQKLKFLEY